MPAIKVSTNFNIDLEFTLAPFHRRFFAWLIDAVVALIYFFIAVKIVSSFKYNNETADDSWTFLIVMLPIQLYPLIAEFTTKGQTLGKRLMGIRVVNESGGNATISQYLLRWLLRLGDLMLVYCIILLSIFGPFIFFFVGVIFALSLTDFILVLATKKFQRIGDLAAGTIVIYPKQESSIHETVFVEVAETYTPKYPEVMRLSDRDLSTIKTIYNGIEKSGDYVLAAQIAAKIQSVLKINTSQSDIEFIATVLKDYNFLSTR